MEVEFNQSLAPAVGNSEIELPKYKHPGEPEHYRLSSARVEGKRSEPEPRTTLVVSSPQLTAGIHSSPKLLTPGTQNFWFRTRYISAFASGLSRNHPHILKLHLRPSATARLIAGVAGFLPALAQSWVKVAFPEWFLPDYVVMKQQKHGEEKEVMDELFDTEVKAYGQLKPLQGVVIPRCYGRLSYKGTRALLLEQLEGVSLASPEGATLELKELSELLQPCYRALHAFGIHHDDPHPSNFQLVDGKLMVLDLERVSFGLPADRNALFMASNIWDIAYRYQGLQVYYRLEGLLEAA